MRHQRQVGKQVEILLHNIRSVYNVGSIFRSAEALGVSKIWLSGYSPTPIDRFGRERADLAKVALGAQKDLPWEVANNPLDLINSLKSEGFLIAALEQAKNSVDLANFQSRLEPKPKSRQPILLIPGTETTGVDKAILAAVDVVLEIKQNGNKESLNVASATAIAIYELAKASEK